MALSLSRAQWQAMQAHVAAEAPLEACGLLGGRDGDVSEVYPLRNAAQSSTRYRIDPVEQVDTLMKIEAAGSDLVAIYHSHPQGPPRPSTTDIAEAAYPEALHLIWFPDQGQWQCSAFRIGPEGALAVKLELKDQPATSN